MLQACWGTAAPLHTRRFGGEVEKFIGDGVVAVLNRSGDQPDHARRAACAALALRAFADLADAHPDWPRMRVGINSGEAVLREIGGEATSRTRWSATRSTPAHGSRASPRSAGC